MFILICALKLKLNITNLLVKCKFVCTHCFAPFNFTNKALGQVSISSTLNARILRTNVLSYVHQSQNVTRKAAKKRLSYKKFARLTVMKLAAGVHNSKYMRAKFDAFVCKISYNTQLNL